jgi:hypothetical protein
MLTVSTLYVDIVHMALLKQLWRQSPSLTTTALLMLGALVFSVAGLMLDPRTITGVPAWLKPAKFAISTAIFAGTAAWIYGYLDVHKALKRVGDLLAGVLILEVAIIDIQAARGTTSHFNNATPLDTHLFEVMGTAIGILWLAMIFLCVALFRQRFRNPSFGWALRLGMLITVIGAGTGGVMVTPTAEQRAAIREHQPVAVIGGHTVGAPDGGPGLPGTGWSTEHGDLRIPHFLGLHALQAIPFLAWVFSRRRRSPSQATRLVFTAAASYSALFAILFWQALRGESIVHPGQLTLSVLGCWFVGTLVAATFQIATVRQNVALQGSSL